LDHVAITADPAHETAVLAVRRGTPNLDRVRELLLAD
jgi:hypothetical protein